MENLSFTVHICISCVLQSQTSSIEDAIPSLEELFTTAVVQYLMTAWRSHWAIVGITRTPKHLNEAQDRWITIDIWAMLMIWQQGRRMRSVHHWHRIDTQPRYSSPTSPISCPTAAILAGSGFGFTSFFELSQNCTLINCPRSKVDNGLLFFVKTTSASSVYHKTLPMHAC